MALEDRGGIENDATTYTAIMEKYGTSWLVQQDRRLQAYP